MEEVEVIVEIVEIVEVIQIKFYKSNISFKKYILF
jgi:hypothetical protein